MIIKLNRNALSLLQRSGFFEFLDKDKGFKSSYISKIKGSRSRTISDVFETTVAYLLFDQKDNPGFMALRNWAMENGYDYHKLILIASVWLRDNYIKIFDDKKQIRCI